MRFLMAWLLAILAIAGTPALAALPPAPNGPVFDQAGIIPDDQEAALDQRLREYNKATGRAVIVATVASLDGAEIETYAVDLFKAWGIGGKASDMGLLLLIAPGERKLRIETGYGLEEYMPDVLAGRIIRDAITPRFKAGDMPGGINAGIDAIIAQLNRNPADAKAVAEAAATAGSGEDDINFGVVVFWIIVIVFFAALSSRGNRHGQRHGRWRGSDPGVFIWGPGLGSGSGGFGSGDSGGGFGGFGGFGGGGSGGGGASGDW